MEATESTTQGNGTGADRLGLSSQHKKQDLHSITLGQTGCTLRHPRKQPQSVLHRNTTGSHSLATAPARIASRGTGEASTLFGRNKVQMTAWVIVNGSKRARVERARLCLAIPISHCPAVGGRCLRNQPRGNVQMRPASVVQRGCWLVTVVETKDGLLSSR
jgi:hypothetical protein